MAVLVRIRKRDKKFRLWSTVVDDYYFEDWTTREDAVSFLKKRVMDRAREECREIENRFPNGYYDIHHKRIWFNNPKELR